MNEVELIDALCERLRDIFYGKKFYSRKKDSAELHDVNIFAQYIPQAEGITIADRHKDFADNYGESDFESNFPCVIVKHLERTDNEERSLIRTQLKLKLIACVYDESSHNEGYRDLCNMMSHMRNDFFEDRFIDSRFRIIMPLKSRIIETDTWPVSYGEIELLCETGRKTAPMPEIYGRRMNDGHGIYEGRIRDTRLAG